MEVISGEKIVKNYGKFEVLKGIGLNVQDGEFVGIIGKSGSGKTTLLKILGLIESVTDGTLLYKKNEISKLSDKELARIRREELGFVFQEFYLMDSLDVFENIMLPFYISKTVDDSKKRTSKSVNGKIRNQNFGKKDAKRIVRRRKAESCHLQGINK